MEPLRNHRGGAVVPRWNRIPVVPSLNYRGDVVAIESEARDSNGVNVHYVTMQITFAHKERNLHCDVVGITTV